MARMKITQDHKGRMYDLLDKVRDDNDLPAYKEALRKDGQFKDLGERFRWDVLWATEPEARQALLREVYDYANSAHVDTVLREWVRLNGL